MRVYNFNDIVMKSFIYSLVFAIVSCSKGQVTDLQHPSTYAEVIDKAPSDVSFSIRLDRDRGLYVSAHVEFSRRLVIRIDIFCNFSQMFTVFFNWHTTKLLLHSWNNTHLQVSHSNLQWKCGAKYENNYRYILRCCVCFSRYLLILYTQIGSTFTQFSMRIRVFLQFSVNFSNSSRFM